MYGTLVGFISLISKYPVFIAPMGCAVGICEFLTHRRHLACLFSHLPFHAADVEPHRKGDRRSALGDSAGRPPFVYYILSPSFTWTACWGSWVDLYY